MAFHAPEPYRVRTGRWATDPRDGNVGMFHVPNRLARGDDRRVPLLVVASDGIPRPGSPPQGDGWEHVSVSLPQRCPTWPEMAYIKGLFWDEEDCVVQYHPPRSQYVNNHEHCLHLWRSIAQPIPAPPAILVGHRV